MSISQDWQRLKDNCLVEISMMFYRVTRFQSSYCGLHETSLTFPNVLVVKEFQNSTF